MNNPLGTIHKQTLSCLHFKLEYLSKKIFTDGRFWRIFAILRVLYIVLIVKHCLHVCLGGVPGPLGGLDTPGLAGAGAHLLLLPPTLPAI